MTTAAPTRVTSIELAADTLTPVAAALRLGARCAFLLESVEGGARYGRYSIAGVKGRTLVMQGRDDPLEVLRAALPAVEPMAGDPAFPLASGVGYLAYEATARWERVPVPDADPLAMPNAVFHLPSSVIVFDHLAQVARVATLDGIGARDRLADVVRTLQTPAEGEVPATFDAAVVPAENDPAGAFPVRGRRRAPGRGDPRRRDAPDGARAPLQRADAAKRDRDLSVPAPDQPVAVPVLPRPCRGRARRGGGRRLSGAAGPRPRRRGRHSADRRNAATPRGPGPGCRAGGGASSRPEGARRARHARRPGAQRRRPRRGAGHRRGHHAARRRALRPRHAPRLRGARPAGRRAGRLRCRSRRLPGGDRERRSKGARHAGHRRAGGGAPGPVRRGGRLLLADRRRVRHHHSQRPHPRRASRPSMRGRGSSPTRCRSARRPRWPSKAASMLAAIGGEG